VFVSAKVTALPFLMGMIELEQENFSFTTGRIQHGHICVKAFYMLGKIYEEKSWLD
jgi:hypothetical protein